MKTIAKLLAVLAAASSLFAASAVQAADGAQAQERINPHAALPFYGYDHLR